MTDPLTGWSAVAVAFFASIPATIAAIAGLRAASLGKQNRATTRRIERATNGELEAKIRKAVIEVFAEHKTEVTEAVMAESVRHLLNAMINEPERKPSHDTETR